MCWCTPEIRTPCCGKSECVRPPSKEEITQRECLARYAHDAWSGWMRYLFCQSENKDDGTVVIPADLARRWIRQMETSYDDLPENEKDSDRHEADKMLRILQNTHQPPVHRHNEKQ